MRPCIASYVLSSILVGAAAQTSTAVGNDTMACDTSPACPGTVTVTIDAANAGLTEQMTTKSVATSTLIIRETVTIRDTILETTTASETSTAYSTFYTTVVVQSHFSSSTASLINNSFSTEDAASALASSLPAGTWTATIVSSTFESFVTFTTHLPSSGVLLSTIASSSVSTALGDTLVTTAGEASTGFSAVSSVTGSGPEPSEIAEMSAIDSPTDTLGNTRSQTSSSPSSWTRSYYFSASTLGVSAVDATEATYASGNPKYSTDSSVRFSSRQITSTAVQPVITAPSGARHVPFEASNVSPVSFSTAAAGDAQSSSASTWLTPTSTGGFEHSMDTAGTASTSTGMTLQSSYTTVNASTESRKSQTVSQTSSTILAAATTCPATGPVTLDFDDLFVHQNDSIVTNLTFAPPVGQITGYYRGLFQFANSAVYAPEPDMSFAPEPNMTNTPRLVAFNPPDGGNVSMGANIGNAAFWFFPKHVMMGCSTFGSACSVEITFYAHDDIAGNVIQTKTIVLDKCFENDEEKCSLQPVDLSLDDEFAPLQPSYGFSIKPILNDSTSRGTVYIDGLELVWKSDDCQAQQERSAFQLKKGYKPGGPSF